VSTHAGVGTSIILSVPLTASQQAEAADNQETFNDSRNSL
jgi:hypothetical protein